MIKNYIKRPIYHDKIKPYIQKDLIKVLIGQRRSGKSCILYKIINTLKSSYQVKKEDVIYINKELHEYDAIKNYEDLLSYVNQNVKKIMLKNIL